MIRLSARVYATSFALAATSATAQTPTIEGSWLPPISVRPTGFVKNTVAPHVVLLKSGRVLCIDLQNDAPDAAWADIVLVDPLNGAAQQVVWEGTLANPYPNDHWLFCSGHASLADGGIIFSGGEPG